MVLELEQETGTGLGMKPKRMYKLKRGGNLPYQLELRATLAKLYDGCCMERSAGGIKINLAILHHRVVALVKSPDC